MTASGPARARVASVEGFLTLRKITFGFPGLPPTVQNLELSVAGGEVHCLLGRSGCGKTTVLKLAAGLLAPDTGEVTVDGRPAGTAREAIGFVFQQPTLLEWLPALDNVLLPVSLKRQPAPEDRERAQRLLAQLGLAGLEARRPHQLSGGQQSRVALARALVLEPQLLLLDEPFAALDALTREDLQQDMLALCARRGTTALFVTHDISEAVFLADVVSVMDQGRITGQVRPELPRVRDAAVRSSASFAALGAQVRALMQQPSPLPHQEPVA